MTELEFCEHWCGELSAEQVVWVKHHVEKETFVGAGRGRGILAMMPLVKLGGIVHVLASDARTYPASSQNQELYKTKDKEV